MTMSLFCSEAGYQIRQGKFTLKATMLLPECTREAAQQQVPRWLQAACS